MILADGGACLRRQHFYDDRDRALPKVWRSRAKQVIHAVAVSCATKAEQIGLIYAKTPSKVWQGTEGRSLFTLFDPAIVGRGDPDPLGRLQLIPASLVAEICNAAA